MQGRSDTDTDPAFLDPIPSTYFDNQSLSTIDLVQKNATKLPTTQEILQKITKARIINCRLSSLPIGLDAYYNLTELDLTENLLTEIPQRFLEQFCHLEVLTLTSNKLKHTNFHFPPTLTNIDLSFNRNINLDGLWNSDLPNMRLVSLAHCQIKELPSDRPKWADTVNAIILDGNELTQFPDQVNQWEKLDEISLFGNHISTISTPKSFKLLNASFNSISEWPSPVMAQQLIIHSNLFSTFPESLFQGNIYVLNISKCNLEGVLDVELPKSLTSFDASHNSITGISERFVASLNTLTILNLSDNKISSLPDNFPNSRLNTIALDRNNLTELPGSLMHGKNMTTFNCSHNKLTVFPEFDFPQLRTLNLSFNQLSELPNTFTSSSGTLLTVNVSFNLLNTLPATLCSCKRVTTFIGAHNKFRVIPKAVFSFSQLKTLILSMNQLNSVPPSIGTMFFLRQLDLSNNHYTEIPQQIGRLNALKVLSMSHNAISNAANIPQGLTFLDLSYNQIQSINLDSVTGLTSLSLDCNKLTEFNPDNLTNLTFLSLSMNQMNTGLLSILPQYLRLPDLRDFEYIGNEINPDEQPPCRLNILSNHRTTYSDQFGIGYSATIGDRPTMEDAILMRYYDRLHSLFALFDGHTGNVSAASSALCLANEVSTILSKDDESLPSAFASCFATVNEKLRSIGVADGCTTVSTLFRGNCGYVAGVGDSRIIIVRQTGVERLTVDSKPLIRSEFERLRSSGLAVNSEGRINRKLAVSRSLGDFWIGDGLFVQPEILKFEITDEDIALIIACDGLWDVIDDEDAGNIVRQSKNAQDAASTLRNAAYALGSKDNISVMVLNFHPTEGMGGFVSKNEVEILPKAKEEVEDDEDLQFPSLPRGQSERRRRR